jgi:hypothetical protein
MAAIATVAVTNKPGAQLAMLSKSLLMLQPEYQSKAQTKYAVTTTPLVCT